MLASEAAVAFPEPFYSDQAFLNCMLGILGPFSEEVKVIRCIAMINEHPSDRTPGQSTLFLARLRLFVLERGPGALLDCLTNLHHVLGVLLSLVEAKELLTSYLEKEGTCQSRIGVRRVSTGSTSSEDHSGRTPYISLHLNINFLGWIFLLYLEMGTCELHQGLLFTERSLVKFYL